MKQRGDVFVVQCVDALPPHLLCAYQVLVAEYAQLMRYGGLLDFERVNQLAYGMRAVEQATENLHPAWGRQGKHRVRDLLRGSLGYAPARSAVLAIHAGSW
ncbi:MAG TPA: hypothetical protein VNU19_10995 [Candidatus Acidoferrum sp.]|nr:hypothetical protein [Candidatus Acidoferrum sp.]